MKKLFAFFILVISALLFSNTASAITITSDYYDSTNIDYNTNYNQTIYNSNSGLDSSEYTAIAQTSDNYIWVGSYAGLYRFNGKSFVQMSQKTQFGAITALYADKNKKYLWIGTSNNGVARYNLQSQEVKFFTSKDGLAADSIRCITSDDKGNIYVGTVSYLTVISPNDVVTSLYSNHSITCVNQLVYSETEQALAGVTNRGICFVIKDQRNTMELSYSHQNGEYFNSITANAGGGFIAGTSNNTLCNIDYNSDSDIYEYQTVTKINSLSSINQIFPNSKNNGYFICADNGIWFLSNSLTSTKLNYSNFNNSILFGLNDTQSNIWFLSRNQGICKLSQTPFTNLLKDTSIANTTVHSVTKYDGLLFIGSDDGLTIYNETIKKEYINSITEKLQGIRVRHILKDSHNNLWISTYSKQGLFYVSHSNGSIRTYNESSGTLGGFFQFTLELKNGDILAASNAGLNFIRKGKIVKTLGLNNGLTTPQILCAVQRKDGSILAGSAGGGIYIIKNRKVHSRLSDNVNLKSLVVSKIIPVDDNSFLYITSNGLYYNKNNKNTVLKNFPYSNIYDIRFFNSNNTVWLCSSSGIYVISMEQLIADNSIRYLYIDKFKGFNSMITSECYNYLDKNKTFYICCTNGLLRCNLNSYEIKPQDISFGIDHILVDNKNIILSNNNEYILPPSTKRISIFPSVLDYTYTNPLVHTYMENVDETGMYQNQSNLTDLNYTNLSYGTYKFHIQILDEKTHYILKEKIITITKQPQFFELFYFKLYLMIVCITIVACFTWIVSKTTNLAIIRRQIEETQLARTEAEHANAIKSQFLANMSHEIRTPINAIMGMNELILRQKTSPDIEKYANDIQHASNTLLSIVNDILDFSKIESGKMNIVCDNYETTELFSDLSSMLRIRAKEKNLRYFIEIDENIPKTLYGDEVRIKQVIINLISNATKYTDSGSITFKVSLKEINESYVNLTFSIVDTGIGIKPEELPKLFKVFERLDEKKNAKVQGTGLGLSITKQLLFMMGSTINVESEYTKGSTFFFDLRQTLVDNTPIGTFDVEQIPIENDCEYAPSFCAPDASILVVDDNNMNLKVFQGLLKPTQIQVDTAVSGKECLQMITQKHYDIVFLDHMMPELDGIETLEEAKKIEHLCQDSPFIILTANAVLGAKDMYLEKGFDDYLAKPVTGDLLEEMIRHYLPEKLLQFSSSSPDTPDTKTTEEVISSDLEIDSQTGLLYSGNMTDLYIELLQMFHDMGENKIAEIEAAYDSEDWTNYEIYVHALKSTSKSIGASVLSEEAKELEFAAKENSLSVIHDKTKSVVEHYRRIMQEALKVIDNLNTGFVHSEFESEEQTASTQEDNVPEQSISEKEDIVLTQSDLQKESITSEQSDSVNEMIASEQSDSEKERITSEQSDSVNEMIASEQSDSEKSNVSPERQQLFNPLKDAIFYFDEDRATEEINKLLEQSFPLRTISTLEQIQFCIERYEWDKAENLANTL